MSESSVRDRSAVHLGVRIAGTGSALPERIVTNRDLESMMDTSDEWIVQRTGIRERRIADYRNSETSEALGVRALNAALADARIEAREVDLVIGATMTASMPTPSASCVIANRCGCGDAAAFDLNAACCGFVFALNVAHEFVRSGQARVAAVVGVDTITKYINFSNAGRNSAILFGDAASALVLRASDDPRQGMLAQAMHADGGRACHLYIPQSERDYFDQADMGPEALGHLHMNGQAVFKFAVTKFPEVIDETLRKAGVRADEVSMFICHQANTRILDAARDRFGIDASRLPVNIDRFGNTVGASVPLVFDECRRAGKVRDGQLVMFLAFGAGLTWGSSLWRL